MKNYWFFVLFLGLFPFSSYGRGSYYITDSATYFNKKINNGNDVENSFFCQVKRGWNIVKFSPLEVKEYGFENGKTYKSFLVKSGNTKTLFFLEELTKGKVTIYYLKSKEGEKRFFVLANDSVNLLELPQFKKEYTILLDSLVNDFQPSVDNIPFVKLKKDQLKRFFHDYNNSLKRPLPRIQYGLSIGITTNQLSSVKKGSIYSKFLSKNDWCASPTFFIDIPILTSNYSFHPELYYNRNGISETLTNNSSQNVLVINYSSICIPLMFRYTFICDKISPYVQAGPIYSRSIKNEGTLYDFYEKNDIIYSNTINSPILQRDMGGLSFGGGLISKYGSKHPWFCEFHYSKFYNLNKENKFLNLNERTFSLGIIF